MSRTLFLCIDESGTEANGDYFTTAGCWFVSENPYRAALNEAKVTAMDTLHDFYGLPGDMDELKGKDLKLEEAETVLCNVEEHAYRGGTVVTSPLPWDGGPVQFNVYGVDAAMCRQALQNFDGDLNDQMALRTFILSSILNPLLSDSPLDDSTYDHIRVLLDGEIWRQAMEASQSTLWATELADVEFSIHDSKKVPGIQFADVAANYKRSRRIDDDVDPSQSNPLASLRL